MQTHVHTYRQIHSYNLGLDSQTQGASWNFCKFQSLLYKILFYRFISQNDTLTPFCLPKQNKSKAQTIHNYTIFPLLVFTNQLGIIPNSCKMWVFLKSE